MSSDKVAETPQLTPIQEFKRKNRAVIENETQDTVYVVGPIVGPIPRGLEVVTRNSSRVPKVKMKTFHIPGKAGNPYSNGGVFFASRDMTSPPRPNKYHPKVRQVPKDHREVVRRGLVAAKALDKAREVLR